MERSLQPTAAFVLHRTEYRETSYLLDFFTLDYGRVSVVARGVRTPRSPLKGLLQLFTPLQITWSGRGELGTLKMAEAEGLPIQLANQQLWNGFYINELLIRLLQRFDPHPALFDCYRQTLCLLNKAGNPEPYLRTFELKLLTELGYGLHFLQQDKEILGDHFYQFHPHMGFTKALGVIDTSTANPYFLGSHLLAIQREDFTDLAVLRSAKRLIRRVLPSILEGKPLRSREMLLAIST